MNCSIIPAHDDSGDWPELEKDYNFGFGFLFNSKSNICTLHSTYWDIEGLKSYIYLNDHNVVHEAFYLFNYITVENLNILDFAFLMSRPINVSAKHQIYGSFKWSSWGIPANLPSVIIKKFPNLQYEKSEIKEYRGYEK